MADQATPAPKLQLPWRQLMNDSIELPVYYVEKTSDSAPVVRIELLYDSNNHELSDTWDVKFFGSPVVQINGSSWGEANDIKARVEALFVQYLTEIDDLFRVS